MPLAVDEGREDEALLDHAVARVRRGPRTGLLYEAAAAAPFAIALIEAMRDGTTISSERGEIVFSTTSAYDPEVPFEAADVRRLSAEQSNTSIAIGARMMLKLLRRLQPGTHPEIEIGRFLTEEAHFANTPALLGVVEHVAEDGTRTALALLQKFVLNQGDAWTLMLEGLRRDFDTVVLAPKARRRRRRRPSPRICAGRSCSGSARRSCTRPSRRPPRMRPSRSSPSRRTISRRSPTTPAIRPPVPSAASTRSRRGRRARPPRLWPPAAARSRR